MFSQVLIEFSGSNTLKGTRWFCLHQTLFPPKFVFPSRFRADVHPIKDYTCYKTNRKIEFGGSIKYVMVKGGEKGILQARWNLHRIKRRNMDGEHMGERGVRGLQLEVTVDSVNRYVESRV